MFGLEASLLKKVRPRIQIKYYYSARYYCGAEYHIRVMLLDENLTVVESVFLMILLNRALKTKNCKNGMSTVISLRIMMRV